MILDSNALFLPCRSCQKSIEMSIWSSINHLCPYWNRMLFFLAQGRVCTNPPCLSLHQSIMLESAGSPIVRWPNLSCRLIHFRFLWALRLTYPYSIAQFSNHIKMLVNRFIVHYLESWYHFRIDLCSVILYVANWYDSF